MILAVFVARWTSFYSVVWSSDKANRGLLHLTFLGLGANTSLLLYLTVYLPKVKGLVDSSAWSVYCPRVVPAMTGIGATSVLLFLRAIWPVWGFLAPLIFGIQIMGLLMCLHFIPVHPRLCWRKYSTRETVEWVVCNVLSFAGNNTVLVVFLEVYIV